MSSVLRVRKLPLSFVPWRHLATSSTGRETLVVLGTGWGSYSVVKTIDKKKYDVIVITPRNHFLFTPLLASTTVGTLEFRLIIQPIRSTDFRQGQHFHLAHAIALDIAGRKVKCQNYLKPELVYDVAYDRLVIGVGALSNTFNVPGVKEHACFLKEVWDARRIRNRILSNFEMAQQPGVGADEARRLLHTVIVGGGPTGIEFGAELFDFVQQDVRKYFRHDQDNVRVTIVESNKILGAFDDRLQRFAESKIRQRHGYELIKSAVTEVCSDHVVLADGTSIPCGLVVWSTGLAPREFTKNLNVQKNERGQILTDQHLQVLDTPPSTVFALGDCADVQEYSLPCTAQVAERQGRYLAKMLNTLHSKPVQQQEPYQFRSLGMLAYIGGFQALSELPADVKLQGVPSWLLWRSAYLTRLGSWRLRMQVPIDWTKTLLFGRDISRIE